VECLAGLLPLTVSLPGFPQEEQQQGNDTTMPTATAHAAAALPHGITITAPLTGRMAEILTFEALDFLAHLHRTFNGTRQHLLVERQRVQQQLDTGWRPGFAPETQHIRAGDWRVTPIPLDLQDRRVEITGPVERKMVINALNSGASCFMADFEDATTPAWDNLLHGQINLKDAVRRIIEYTDPHNGKSYRLQDQTATLLVRPRGWHLDEAHVQVDGVPLSGSLFDFGLYLFHNAEALRQRGTGPYYYLPKLEHYQEARLWHDVIAEAEGELRLPQGTVKVTVLIETILAAFQMDEILYELRDYCVGLNCGRWDYIFSVIKKLRHDPGFILPDRAQVTMTVPMMRAYSHLLIQTCHRRGAFAMGGMAAQIPIKSDPEANEIALNRVRLDKEREASDGHDGTWVAHPGLVPVARQIFDRLMPTPNQLHVLRADEIITAADLLQKPQDSLTENGMRGNIRAALGYLTAWLAGNGCVPINNLMEDAATAEISRAQLWQALRHGAQLEDGRVMTVALFDNWLTQEAPAFTGPTAAPARELLRELCTAANFCEFLTLPAYQWILSKGL
jgi:malate synthase